MFIFNVYIRSREYGKDAAIMLCDHINYASIKMINLLNASVALI